MSSLAEIGWATWGFVPHFVPHTAQRHHPDLWARSRR
jgi:hypothetical protein